MINYNGEPDLIVGHEFLARMAGILANLYKNLLLDTPHFEEKIGTHFSILLEK